MTGGLDEERDERGVGARAVESLLDGQNLRVLGRLTDEVEDGLETVIGVVEKDVTLADMEEDVVLLAEPDDSDGGEALVFEVGPFEFGGDRHEADEIKRPVDAVDVLLV